MRRSVLLLVLVLYLVPAASLLNIHAISESDTKWIIVYLGLSVLLGQLEQLMSAAYTCVARYAFGSFLKSVISLAAFCATMVPIVLGYGPRTMALVYAVASALGTLTLCLFVRKDIPWIEFGWKHARFSEIRRLASPAFAFMGFPIGIALNLQGTLIAVGYALGPVDVAIFASARTVSRVALQMVQMVNATFWPELSLAYGAKNVALTRTLHRRACQLALVIAVFVVAGMMTVGRTSFTTGPEGMCRQAVLCWRSSSWWWFSTLSGPPVPRLPQPPISTNASPHGISWPPESPCSSPTCWPSGTAVRSRGVADNLRSHHEPLCPACLPAHRAGHLSRVPGQHVALPPSLRPGVCWLVAAGGRPEPKRRWLPGVTSHEVPLAESFRAGIRPIIVVL